MTRFARAKGSKSSNLKEPDDSTPWEVMKEQLLQAKKEGEESKKREEAENQRMENYNNFLKERKVQKRQATWCDFPEAGVKMTKSPKQKKVSEKSNSIKQVPHTENVALPTNNRKENGESSECNSKQNKTKRKQLKQKQIELDSTECNDHGLQKANNDEDAAIPKNKKNKKKNKGENILQGPTELISQEVDNETQNEHTRENKGKNKKKQNPKTNTNTSPTKNENSDRQSHNNMNGVQKKKEMKNKGAKPVRRKEINDNSFQLIINGKEVELVRYDGFPIMKRDAERIDELKNSMIKKGIPKSEVNRTIKLERRRAEKALARLKRDVCYNCRKGGHNLSDCPDLKSSIPGVQAADGLCFKCGSTEHRQFECKVQKDKEFRFASCFICKEQGHIARQCPDNPKGLYPNGGCCKLCGDVTHLRKDCPTVQNTKEETSIKLHTLDSNSNIEDMEFQTKPVTITTEAAKKPKKIRF